ncbi:pentatricopeptide repeat-containing protein At1g64583, mitochondrial isoform X3 [Cannabis sativa]|nr:pentatricopeptide repeat-containing protein At1g64583, mitochondrial isoform X3 [Cannabis sativa]XP_060960324.1 pentatricopeptide repeat-containing protein At1g64583, mitochondrial isoform X3 [Cannabis sativa]
MVSHVIKRIGAVRSRYLVEFMWENHYRYESHFSVLNTLMRGFLNAEMGYEALLIVNKMREVGVSPSSSACRILFKLLIRNGEYSSVWKLFRDMVSKGPPISTHTFNVMILGFCRTGFLSTGESLLHVIRKFGCEPDVYGYNIVINANCMMGKISNSLEWIHFMISNGCEPSIVTFNTVINGLCKEGDMVKARSFFDGILEVGVFPNTVTYNIMIDGYVKSGDIDEGDKLYEEMKNKGVNPDGMTFNILIAGHYKYRKENIRDMLLRDLVVQEVFPFSSLFDISIAGLCWAGRLDEAMESVKNMLEKGFPLSVVAFNSIIAAYSKAGLEEQAYEAYSIMSRLGLTPSSSTCGYLLLGLCKKGCLNKAKKLLCDMIEKGFPINKLAFLVLLNGYLRTRNPNGA